MKFFLQEKQLIFGLVSSILLCACQPENKKSSSKSHSREKAEEIINQSLSSSANKNLATAEIHFNYHGEQYTTRRNCNLFKYEHYYKKYGDVYKDVYTNTGFKHYKNGKTIQLPQNEIDERVLALKTVNYLPFVPYGLTKDRVFKTYLEDEVFKGKTYEVIQVRKPDNIQVKNALYWLEKDTKHLKFISYHAQGETYLGVVKNTVQIDGFTLANFDVYRLKKPLESLSKVLIAYQKEEVEKVANYAIENVEIKQLNTSCK